MTKIPTEFCMPRVSQLLLKHSHFLICNGKKPYTSFLKVSIMLQQYFLSFLQWIYFVNDCFLPQQNSFIPLLYLAHVGLNPAVLVPVKLVGMLTVRTRCVPLNNYLGLSILPEVVCSGKHLHLKVVNPSRSPTKKTFPTTSQ